ncbi:258_t:CDS:2 [Paraglomus occultum]|uniref:258_t:CDS:1 n=1 Tax=Paraglomus occultum TaxID=144539 RepID=A0A9N9ACB6_9GLOM|nr:258_t:CDS:2 [Paraglomus occultum]
MAPTTASNPPPFSINGLRAKKKNELIDIASSLGLDTSGLKSDLESRIKLYYNQQTINHATEDASPATRRSGRTFSSQTHQEAVNGNRTEGLQTSINEKQEIQDVPRETTPYPPQPSVVENSQLTPIPRDTETQPEPTKVSPLELLKSYLNVNSPRRIADNMRQKVTDAQSLVKVFLATEILIFLYSAIEWKSDAILDPTSDDSYYPGPDLSVLIDWHQFWRPLLNFFAFLVVVPYLLSYIFNFEPSRLSYSPFAFAVAQGAMLAVSSGNLDWSEDVRQYIPDVVVYVGATVVGLFAFYESMLFTKMKA